MGVQSKQSIIEIHVKSSMLCAIYIICMLKLMYRVLSKSKITACNLRNENIVNSSNDL